MINKIQSNNTFGSTRIRYNAEDLKKTGMRAMDKYLKPVREQGFDITGRMKKTPQLIADSLENGRVAFVPSDNGFTIVGHNNESDNLIGKLLTKLFPNEAKFTNDIK